MQQLTDPRTRPSARPRLARALNRLSLAAGVWFLASCQPQAPASAPASPPAPVAPAPEQSDVAPEAAVEYATLPPDQREPPPAASASPPWSFPKLDDLTLGNGLSLKLAQRTTLPLVDITLVVRSGQAADGDRPGLALLAGEMLKVGGTGAWTSHELLDRVESLGSSLSVITSADATTITMAVTSDRFDEALDLIGLVTTKPQFSDAEFRKLKRREMDRVSSLARTDANWAASMVLFRELYQSTGAPHPYSRYDATKAELDKIALWEIKAWHKRHFSPKNAVLVIAGDVSPERAKQATQRALGKWTGAKVVGGKFTSPTLEGERRVYLVDRPDSSQAELRLALFGPEHDTPDYPLVRVANQVLGGGVAGRLFLDVREKRSLAYSTYSRVERVGQGPQPIVLSAGTQTAKAGLTLQALIEHADRMAVEGPSREESVAASRYLSDLFLLRMESVDSLASMVAQLAIHDLPNGYYDEYRAAVSGATPEAVAASSKRYFGASQLVVVAGDAERLATPLSHFGEVIVLDPDKAFGIVKTLPKNPDAKIELERVDGT